MDRRTSVVRLSLLSVILCACSSESTSKSSASTVDASTADSGQAPADAGSTQCTPRSGNYNYVDKLVSGTCGPASNPTSFGIADSTQTFAMPFVIGEKLGAGKSGKIEQYVPRCTGTISVSADNCSIEYSFKCPQASAPGIFQKVGTITWAPDGKSANESQDYSEYSDGGAQTCSGKYAPSISK